MIFQALILIKLLNSATSQPSVNACNGKSDYDDCSYTRQNGDVVVGVCSSGTCTQCSQETNCPTDQTGVGYQGTVGCTYISKPAAAPLRGNIGCLTPEALQRRPTAGNQNLDAVNIYGPMEAGFTSQQISCLGSAEVSGGHDTKLAEEMVLAISSCEGESITVLDDCGGHANPYHYHERMECLYESSTTGHSTRVGTALDGNGIYGPYIDGGVLPCDLDACGGRVGVTPDSNGQEVYYYMITSYAPFTVGCFGSADHFTTYEECLDLYPDECGSAAVSVTTLYGTGMYALDCPCFDTKGSNTNENNDFIPGFLSTEEIEHLPVSRCNVTDDNDNDDSSSEDSEQLFIYIGASIGAVVFLIALMFLCFTCQKAKTYTKK